MDNLDEQNKCELESVFKDLDSRYKICYYKHEPKKIVNYVPKDYPVGDLKAAEYVRKYIKSESDNNPTQK
jgi:hypothetical protein